MAKRSTELFESEWAILGVVWEHEPCTAPEVQEILRGEKGWAYTTVKTIMDRMVKKGLLKTRKIRNLYLYNSAITRPRAQRSEIMRTVKRAFGGAFTPMVQFLIDNEELSDEQYDSLEKLIKARKHRKLDLKKKR